MARNLIWDHTGEIKPEIGSIPMHWSLSFEAANYFTKASSCINPVCRIQRIAHNSRAASAGLDGQVVERGLTVEWQRVAKSRNCAILNSIWKVNRFLNRFFSQVSSQYLHCRQYLMTKFWSRRNCPFMRKSLTVFGEYVDLWPNLME